MATVIDSLLITLGLDRRQFDRDREESERNLRRTGEQMRVQARDMEKAGDIAAGFYRRLRNGALSFFTLLLGGQALLTFTRDIIQGDAAVGRFAHSIGIATDTVSAWQNAVKAVGGTAEDAQQSLSALSQELVGVQQGLSAPSAEFVTAIARINPNIDPYKMKADELLRALAPSLQKMDEATAYRLAQQAGIQPGVTKLLRQGNVDQALADARKRGVTDDAAAKRAQDFLNTLERIGQEIEGIGRSLLEPILPAIEAFLKQIEAFLAANKDFIDGTVKKAIADLGKTLEGMKLEDVAKAARGVADELAKWIPTIETLIGLWAGAQALRFLAFLALATGGPGGLAMLGGLLGLGAWAATAMLGGDAAPGQSDKTGALGDKDYYDKHPDQAGDVNPMNWLSYQAEKRTGAGPQVDVSDPAVQQRIRQAIAFFKGKGLSDEDAAAVVGQLLSENAKLDPNALGDRNPTTGEYESVGILQWHLGRRNTAGALVGRDTIAGATYEQQLEAVWGELERGEYKNVLPLLKQAQGPLAKSGVLTRLFVKPKDQSEQVIRERALRGDRALEFSRKPMGLDNYGRPLQNVPGLHKSSFTFGDVNIYTKTDDPQGLGRKVRGAIEQQLSTRGVVLQANRGQV